MQYMELAQDIIKEVKRVVIGKDECIWKALAAILAGGHILIEDIPGVGKTTLALALAKSMGLDWKRVQCTPDILPSDLVGFSMYQKERDQFVYQAGAVMCNLFLADELNRTSPKTQSALLEVMEEGTVTVDQVTREVPKPFFVIATENPMGSTGTQMLPESQLDRFMICMTMGYPDIRYEIEIIKGNQKRQSERLVHSVISASMLQRMQEYVEEIYVHDRVYQYIGSLIQMTREHPMIAYGVSPRGTIALAKMAKATAFLHGREYCTPKDVQDVFLAVTAHRISLNAKARAQRVDKEEILRKTSEYDLFVSKQYLKIDAEQKKKLQQIPLEGETLFEISAAMEQWLGAHISYSLSPGKVPWGKEYVEYFLFENKKGYCVHYATAATLLFRSHDIPARFVSGYLIGKEQWKTSDDGTYQVTVTGADAHAWTEIYTGDGIWIPVELTPTYGRDDTSKAHGTDLANVSPEVSDEDSQRVSSDSQMTESNIPKEYESGTKEANDKNVENQQQGTEKNAATNVDAEKEDNGTKRNLLIKQIKQLLLLILMSIISFGAWRFYKVQQRQGIFAKNRNEKAQKIFSSLYEVLRFAGMAENDCLGDGFGQEAKKVCDKMEVQIKAAQQTALKAWYSGDIISAKEERELCRIYRNVCRLIVEKLTFREKILFYFTKCFL